MEAPPAAVTSPPNERQRPAWARTEPAAPPEPKPAEAEASNGEEKKEEAKPDDGKKEDEDLEGVNLSGGFRSWFSRRASTSRRES